MTTTTPPVTLATWLLAQLDAEQALAEAGDGLEQLLAAHWWRDPSAYGYPGVCDCGDPAPTLSAHAAHVARVVRLHIAAQDPATTLARIAALREVVELAEEATGLDLQVDSEFRVGFRDEATEPYLGDVILRALAQPYAGRDGWDASWGM